MSNKKKIKIKKIKLGPGQSFTKSSIAPKGMSKKEMESLGYVYPSGRSGISFKSSGGKIKGYSAGGKIAATSYKSCGANIVGTK